MDRGDREGQWTMTWRKRKIKQNQQDTMKFAIVLVGVDTQGHSFMLQRVLLFATAAEDAVLLLLSPIDK